MERPIDDSASRADGDSFGCLLSWLGSRLREDPYRRTVVTVGTRDAHQRLRAESSSSGLTVLGQRLDRDISITTTGQPDGGSVHQPLGGDSLSPSHRTGEGSMAVGSLQGSGVGSSAHSGNGQPDSRFRVQRAEGSLGLELVPSSISENQYNSGSRRGGPVCISPILPTRVLFQLEARSLAEAMNAFQQDWAPVKGYADPHGA